VEASGAMAECSVVKTKMHKRVFYVDGIDSKAWSWYLEMKLPSEGETRLWDRHFSDDGRRKILLTVAASLQVLTRSYHSKEKEETMPDLIKRMFLGVFSCLDPVIPQFKVVECLVECPVTSYRQDIDQSERRLHCANVLNRELLVDAVGRCFVTGKVVRIELLLRLSRRWMTRYLSRHHLIKMLPINAPFVNKTINH
jgi:hypothetical protein